MTAEDGDEEPLSEGASVWLQSVEEEKRLIEALPFVKGEVAFIISDKAANANKVQASVWCCWDGGNQSFKRVIISCDEKVKLTHLEALRALRVKLVNEHGQSDHPVHSKAAERRAELRPEEPKTLFDRQRLAAARQQAAVRQAEADEKHADQARQAEASAVLARQQAEATAKASKALADALKPPTASHKRQRTAFAGPSSSATTRPPHFSPEPSTEPEWNGWPIHRWKKHETEELRRRAVPLEPFIGPLPCGVSRGSKVTDAEGVATPSAQGNATLPRGEFGWRRHPRRGIYGSLCSWASGNRSNIAFMLAESAKYFGVVDQVPF